MCFFLGVIDIMDLQKHVHRDAWVSYHRLASWIAYVIVRTPQRLLNLFCWGRVCAASNEWTHVWGLIISVAYIIHVLMVTSRKPVYLTETEANIFWKQLVTREQQWKFELVSCWKLVVVNKDFSVHMRRIGTVMMMMFDGWYSAGYTWERR